VEGHEAREGHECITSNEIEVKEIRLPARHVPHIVASQSLASYNNVASFRSLSQWTRTQNPRRAEQPYRRAGVAARTSGDLRGPGPFEDPD